MKRRRLFSFLIERLQILKKLYLERLEIVTLHGSFLFSFGLHNMELEALLDCNKV